jgi:hypothetical protein
MATIFESLTDAEIEAMLAELENQQAAEAILAGQNPELQSMVEGDVGTTGGQVATDLGQIPINRDVDVIGADGGLFTGGLGKPTTLPPVVVSETKPAGGSIFDPNALAFAPTGQDLVGGSQLGGGAGTGTASTGFKAAPTMPEDTPFGKIYNDELARRNAIRASKGQLPISAIDTDEIKQLADWSLKEQDKLFEQQDAETQRQARTNAAAAAQKVGIPLIIPLPIDPVTGLILTGAGLLASGGNIATVNPNDPLGSLVDAAKGTAGAIGNVIDVVTDPAGVLDRMGTQPGGTTGSGQSTTNVPVIVGAGALGGSSSGAGATAGAGQATGGAGAVVGAGALGGQTTPSTATPTIYRQTGSVEEQTPIIFRTQSDWGQPVGTGPADVAQAGDIKIGTFGLPTNTGSGKKGGDVDIINDESYVVGPGLKDVDVKQKTCPTGQQLDASGNCVPIINPPPPPPPPTKCEPGYEKNAAGECVPIVVGPPQPPPPPPPPPPTTPPATPIFMNNFTFTKTTPGQVALRDFEKEFGLTSSTLMGDKAKELANFYQQLQSQFTPSTLTQLAGTSQQQLMSDLDRLAMAQRGQLSPEDVRSAQQSAREAYAARGQVMAPGAIGAEILNRDVLRRQREAEARANVQQSMANLGAAAQLQTGNIFAPFAKLLAETYGPTSEYANAVYDYNVNAYNAYQAAQENLAAYKEAAAKGEQAQFIATFANFLANNGVQTTQQQLSKIFQGLFGKG